VSTAVARRAPVAITADGDARSSPQISQITLPTSGSVTMTKLFETYIDWGWHLVAIPRTSKSGSAGKNPNRKGWDAEPPARLEDLIGKNAGVHLGPSGLVDIDLDCPEAIKLAPDYLEATATFGRAHASHYIYEGSAVYKKFRDPVDKACILEIRSGTGMQTVFPGSIYVSTGEKIRWHDTQEIAEITDLTPVGALAAAAWRLKHGTDDMPEAVRAWAEGAQPTETVSVEDESPAAVFFNQYDDKLVDLIVKECPKGSRHDYRLAVAGAMRRGGISKKSASKMLVAAMGDERLGDDRSDAIDDARASVADTYAATRNTTGAKTLLEDFQAKRVVKRIDTICVIDDPEVDVDAGSGEDPSWVGDVSSEELMDQMNGKYAWIESVGRVLKLTKSGAIDCLVGTDAFRTTHDNHTVRKTEKREIGRGSFWLKAEDRRSNASFGCWAPPKQAPHDALNLWSGFATQPKPGDWSLMRRHIIETISESPEIAGYIFRWITWMLQNPGERAGAAIVLLGKQGVGKGMLGETLMQLIGAESHALQITNPEHFACSRFNAHLEGKVFLFADECYWPGNRSHGGTLKGLVTEPRLTVERKGIDAYPADNSLHVLISSNESWVIPAGVDDRRFVVTTVKSTHKEDWEYFEALVHERENGGLGAMLHDLLHADLGGWNPRSIVTSNAKRGQQEQSLPPEDEWLLHMLESGTLPSSGYGVRGSHVVGSSELLIDAREQVPSLRNYSIRKIIPSLAKIGCISCRKNDQRGWQFASLSESREAWCKSFWPREWPECDDWLEEN